MHNDALDAQFGECALNPESAETGFIDEVIRSVGIVFLEIGNQFQRRWVHGESLEFNARRSNSDFPLFEMDVDANEKVLIDEIQNSTLHKSISYNVVSRTYNKLFKHNI